MNRADKAMHIRGINTDAVSAFTAGKAGVDDYVFLYTPVNIITVPSGPRLCWLLTQISKYYHCCSCIVNVVVFRPTLYSARYLYALLTTKCNIIQSTFLHGHNINHRRPCYWKSFSTEIASPCKFD